MDAVTGAVLGTAITATSAIAVAFIGRPSRAERQKKRERDEEILANTRKTGNGWTEHLGERLNRMETSLEARMDLNAIQHQEQIRELTGHVGRLEGRLDEHLREIREVPQQRQDDGQEQLPL